MKGSEERGDVGEKRDVTSQNQKNCAPLPGKSRLHCCDKWYDAGATDARELTLRVVDECIGYGSLGHNCSSPACVAVSSPTLAAVRNLATVAVVRMATVDGRGGVGCKNPLSAEVVRWNTGAGILVAAKTLDRTLNAEARGRAQAARIAAARWRCHFAKEKGRASVFGVFPQKWWRAKCVARGAMRVARSACHFQPFFSRRGNDISKEVYSNVLFWIFQIEPPNVWQIELLMFGLRILGFEVNF